MQQAKSLQLYIRSSSVQASIEDTLKDRAGDFTTSLLTVINGNPLLQECDYMEVVRTALKAASMRLPIDPNLGLAYIIPYNNKKSWKERNDKGVEVWKEKWVYEPQLQIGWRGFIQLALRTKQYQRINVTDVREGEHKGINRMTGDIEFEWEQDSIERNRKPITGYLGYFRLVGGFEKMLYMTVEELESHAKQYSKSYKNGGGVWRDQKAAMSSKTVIKLLVSKYGPQSTDIQRALRADQAAMAEDDNFDYLDNKPDVHPAEDPQVSPDEEPQVSPSDDIPEGEIIDASTDENTEQADEAAATEAEGPQDQPPAAAPQPPKDTRSVKEKAAQWAADRKARADAEAKESTDDKA